MNAKLMKVLSKTVAAVYIAYTYGFRHTWVMRKLKFRFMNVDKYICPEYFWRMRDLNRN